MEFVQQPVAQIHNPDKSQRICHILQISDGISLALWKSTSYIRGKIIYKLVTPRFMLIDYTTNIMIQKQHISIHMNRRTILCSLYFTFIFSITDRYSDVFINTRLASLSHNCLSIHSILHLSLQAPYSLLSLVSYSASPIFSINVTSAGSYFTSASTNICILISS